MKKFVFLLIAYFITHSEIFGQCTIEITSISQAGLGSPPPAVNIAVSGMVKNGGCDSVEIKLCCSNNVDNTCKTQIVAVNADNSWSTLFKNFICICISNSFVVIAKASCSTNPNCIPAQGQLKINCQSGSSCPQISNVTTSIGNCMDDPSGCKKRDVIFSPTISGQCDGYVWSFGDNQPDESGSGIPQPIHHFYFIHPQVNPVLTVFKVGCNPIAISFPIIVPDFPLCGDCPPVGAVNLSQLNTNKCVLSGTITANFCEKEYTNYMINYGDGSSETFNINTLNGKEINHTYSSDGNYNLNIILERNGANCTFSKSITISKCGTCKDCPGNGGNGSCGWKFWECLCGWLSFIVGLWVATRLILMAGGWSFTLPVGTFSWAAIFEAIGLGFAIWIAYLCPCSTAWAIMIGAATSFISIIIMLNNGVSLPKWFEAIVIALALISTMILFISINC